MVFLKIKKKKNFVAHSTVDFQITLSTYKLNSQNKKIIYIKNKNTILKKKSIIARTKRV